MTIQQRFAARDLKAMIAMSDARKAQNAEWRNRCLANEQLKIALLADAKRMGLAEINWPEYFRNLGISE